MGTVVRLECARLFRSRALVAALSVWVLAAGAALVNGERVVDRQRGVLAASDALQQEQHDAVLAPQPAHANAGDQLYYLAHHTRHQPSAWAALAVGQRDVRSFNVKVRLLALHGQLYDGDISSPIIAALGTFDLAFVLVALAPLLVVALCHDVVSGEREAGTWPLVRAQPTSALAVLAVRLAVRYAALAGVVTATVAAAPLVTDVAWDGRLLALMGTMALYLLVWVSLAAVVATLRQPSDVNALALLGVWVVGVVVGPALLMGAAAARFPTPEALELTVAARQGYHASWDRPVPETMARFYERYPEWRHATVPTDRYSNAWYYAMQHWGDVEAEPAARAYRAAIEARHAWVSRWLPLLPPARLQAALDRAARTDLPSHLAYLDSVAGFHEALKQRFFPAIFEEATIADVVWRDLPRHDHRDEGAASDLWAGAGPLALWGVVVLGVVWRRREHLSRI